jgi:DNA polymerase-3 subunit epsilon
LTPLVDKPEEFARLLDLHPDYRVLRRLVPRTDFGVKPLGPVGRVVILDTETTGLDSKADKIIELALLVVEVDTATGAAVRVAEVYEAFEDPGRPIPPDVSELTGISDEMVRGRKLDEVHVAARVKDAQLVVAHNARFDRPFVEARLPAFASLPWACSIADIDWAGEGWGSSRLEYLAMKHGWFYDGHRAAADCHALLAVLNAPLPRSGTTGLARLLQAARATSFRVFADDAPFAAKDLLKSHGYRWDPERRVWHGEVRDEAALDEERAWLKAKIYGGRSSTIHVEKQDARLRYSARSGKRTSLKL